MGIPRVAPEHVERVIGTIRRECLDLAIVFKEADLYRHMNSFAPYYHESRTHLWPAKDTPEPRPAHPSELGPVVAIPQVGRLHHRYQRRAAWISQGSIPALGGDKCISTRACLRIELPCVRLRQIRGARSGAKQATAVSQPACCLPSSAISFRRRGFCRIRGLREAQAAGVQETTLSNNLLTGTAYWGFLDLLQRP